MELKDHKKRVVKQGMLVDSEKKNLILLDSEKDYDHWENFMKGAGSRK